MEEKEKENEDEDNDNVINITTTQLFGTPDEAFLIKKIRRRRRSRVMNATRTVTEEKKGDDGEKNSNGAAKRGKNKGGCINGYVPNEK